MIKLAVFDIDGTLIPATTHTIAPETVKAIHALKKRGIYTVIASGRQLQTIQPEIKEIGFDYYICSNGAYIANRMGTVLAQRNINQKIVDSLVQDMIDRDYPIDLRYVDGSRQGNPNRTILEYSKRFFSEAQLKKVMEQAKKDETKDYSEKLPIACLAHIDPEMKPWFERRYPQLLFMITMQGMLCDINPAGVHKGTGLQDICAFLNIDVGDTIAFGDDANDVDMIRTAGIGVAMGNAVPEVKAVAKEQTVDCEELGVVKSLKRHGLLA
jgi:hypothetical protein